MITQDRRSRGRVRRVALTTIIGCLAMSSVGCLPLPKPSEAPKEKCTSEFHLWSNEEPLGTTAGFLRVAEEMAATPGATTNLDEISRRAGWSEASWDRVLLVSGGTTSADLNELAGTIGICFDGFGSSDPDSGFDGHYVFFDGPTPRQTAPAGPRPVIETGESPVIRRNEPLVSDTSLKMPVLHPVTAETP
ncbi:hypothetical protein RD149_07675 [Gordonia westfalica]|uniref:Lipoprotein n=1 Tax=Gordonia westfalica TaxID=158898 RepID=A0ABU2GQA4_9ACTN|nr:hypothetical protein [Gordonia westfalica]MDS1113643.1 hypothetical protein [Gordonia westfalica]